MDLSFRMHIGALLQPHDKETSLQRRGCASRKTVIQYLFQKLFIQIIFN